VGNERFGLDAWLSFEQTVNDRIVNAELHSPIEHAGNTVRPELRPEAQKRWPMAMVRVPRAAAREYGFPLHALGETLGLRLESDEAPLFVHPQSLRLYRAEIARVGLEDTAIEVTPTASYRSLFARSADGRSAVLKVSLGATIGRVHRALREEQIARGLLVSQVLASIPESTRGALQLEWFPELAGVVDRKHRRGWLLRGLPKALAERSEGTLVPAFSLISRRTDARGGVREPLLVELVRRASLRPELFVVQNVLGPYIRTLAYLLLCEGIEYEGHMQNVLFELDGSQALTGKVALRDLSDASLNLALRIARQKALPVLAAGFLPRDAPFSMVANAAGFHVNSRRAWLSRAHDTVDRYGLHSFVWALNRSLERFFPGYASRVVEHAYLELWQRAAVAYLGVRPERRTREPSAAGSGLFMDEAIAHFLRARDWASHDLRASALPVGAQALMISGRAQRKRGPAYRALDTSFGQLFLDGTLPAFFRPAF
jgi:hypothetical protein